MTPTHPFRNYRTFRSTMNESNHLTTRELADLGISKSDIPAVARQSIR